MTLIMQKIFDALDVALDKIEPRKKPISEGDYILVDEAGRFTVRNLSIRIATQDHGVVVRIFPLGKEAGPHIASAYAPWDHEDQGKVHMDWTKSCYYDAAQKARFHREAKKQLNTVAHLLGLETGDFDLRSNTAGAAVSGEIILHTDSLYVQVGQSCMGHDKGILIRVCRGRQDYTGGQNHFAPLSWLDTPEKLAAKCSEILKGGA